MDMEHCGDPQLIWFCLLNLKTVDNEGPFTHWVLHLCDVVKKLIIMNFNKASLIVKCWKIFYWSGQKKNIICHLLFPEAKLQWILMKSTCFLCVTAPRLLIFNQLVCTSRQYMMDTLWEIKTVFWEKKIWTRLRLIYHKDKVSKNELWFRCSQMEQTRSTVCSAVVQFPLTVGNCCNNLAAQQSLIGSLY